MKFKAEGCTIELEIVHDKERRWFRTGMVDLMFNGDLLMRAHIAHVTPVYQMLRDNLRAHSISLIESDGGVISNGGNFDNPAVAAEPRTIDGKIVGYSIDLEQYAPVLRNYSPTPSWREIGVQYVYPACCIESFVNLEHIKHPQPLKLDGTGYVPCKSCNERYSEQEMADRINALRYKCLKPFTTNRMDHLGCEEG